MKYHILEFLFYLQRKMYCFLNGHKLAPECYRIEVESYYCICCDLEIDDWFPTIPYYLQCWYCWMVERDWEWFNTVDIWLLENHHKRLPKWWEF